MLTLFISIIGILLTLLFVIGIHELGHFLVARLMGVKVLRFSIGFGKALKTWHGKTGTEYIIAAIPLGGYIKMLDETEAPVATQELHLAYNRQPLYKRIPIVIAGPLFNFIFAIILYWLIFMIGFVSVAPVIGKVMPQSIAEQAGVKAQQEIISIDDHATHDWLAIAIQMLSRAGEKGQMNVGTKDLASAKIQNFSLDITHWQLDKLQPDPLTSLGIMPLELKVPAMIGKILPGSPAEKSALKLNDKIIMLNEILINDWQTFTSIITQHPGETLSVTLIRDGKSITIPLHIGTEHFLFGKKYGFLGIAPQFEWPKNLLRTNQYGPIAAIVAAYDEFKKYTYINFVVIGKLFTGKLSLQSLGGPITIFESAGNALNHGVIAFLNFLAFLSISIGIINILPIPGLDGGHLLFQLIESIIRRPISLRIQTLCYRLGFIILLLIITQALINDVMRMAQ